MSAREAHSSVEDQPHWIQRLRVTLDGIVGWRGWPKRWRPWLAARADDLIELSIRGSTRLAPGARGLRTPEQITRDILENAVDSSGEAPFSETPPQPSRDSDDEPPQPAPAAGTQVEQESPVESVPDDTAAETEANGKPAEALPIPQRPAPEVFLRHMQEETERQSAQVEHELDALRRQERMVFSLLLVAAAVTLVLLVIGTGLVLGGLVAVGVVSGLVALFPGTGTLILRRLERRIGADKDDVSAVRADNVRLLQAIQMTLMIDDAAERSRKVAALSDELIKSALGGRAPSRRGARSETRAP